jgi:hypothetical protein
MDADTKLALKLIRIALLDWCSIQLLLEDAKGVATFKPTFPVAFNIMNVLYIHFTRLCACSALTHVDHSNVDVIL